MHFWFLIKRPELHTGTKTASSKNIPDETRWLHVKEFKIINSYHPILNLSTNGLNIFTLTRYTEHGRII